MAAIRNSADKILQAATTRTTNLASARVLLTPSTNAFHVTAAGANDPASITFSAALIDLEGAISFAATGGTLTSITATAAVLTYANMPGATATVTASVTANGQTYSATCAITKVLDGTNGANGTNGTNGTNGVNGSRGAGHFYAAGSAWSDATADVTTPGANITDDVVTISSGTFVMEKRWDGAAWVAMGTVINGNLLVDGSVVAAKITTNGLIVRATDGTPIVGIGVPLNAAYAAQGTLNSDLNIGIGAGNKISNAGPVPGSIGTFTIWANNTGITANFAPSYDPFRPAENGGVWLQIPGTPAAGTVADVTDIKRPVIGGQRYEFHVYVSSHRCEAEVYCAWYRSDGTVSDTAEGGYLAENPASGYSLSAYGRPKLFATAPADAVAVMVRARARFAGTANPSLFMSMWYAGAALPAQTVPSEWSDGDATLAATSAQTTAATKLNKSAADTLAGRVALQADGAIVAGDLTFDANGNRTGGTGSAMNQKGFVHYGPDATAAVVINAAGVAVKGDISGSTGTFGAVVIGSTCSFGQTAYDTGTGGWIQGGATPKMSLKAANGSSFLCDPANNVLSMNGGTIAGSTLTAPILPTLSISGFAGISTSGPNGTLSATMYANPSGGRAGYTLSWVAFKTSGGLASATLYLGTTSGTQVQIYATGTNTIVSGEVSVTVTDANGQSATYNTTVSFQFGTP